MWTVLLMIFLVAFTKAAGKWLGGYLPPLFIAKFKKSRHRKTTPTVSKGGLHKKTRNK